jgi:hypothetical protein
MRRTRALWPAIAAALFLAAAPAAASERWLHIRAEEGGREAQTVRVNVPLSLLESVAPLLQDAHLEKGKMKVGDSDLDRAKLRELWDAVRRAQDGEYVTVESPEERVRVAKSGDYLLVKVRGSGEKSERVDVKLPLPVVDALLSGNDDELNLVAAVRALKDRGDGDLVAVTDRSTVVRIWIDGKNGSE